MDVTLEAALAKIFPGFAAGGAPSAQPPSTAPGRAAPAAPTPQSALPAPVRTLMETADRQLKDLEATIRKLRATMAAPPAPPPGKKP
jgi:hypothetical protein